MTLAEFVVAMERELDNNSHKESWRGYSPKWLLKRLRQETAELTRAIEAKKPYAEVLAEAADVANFAMMVADVCEPEEE